MEKSGGDNSPSLRESAGSNTWMRSWDNSSTLSALNIGCGSEIDGRDEDKEIASKAVAFVIRSSRKGVVPLCADVASLLKIKWRLERTIKAQQLEIHRLLSMSRTHCNQSAASTQTNSSGRSSPSSSVQSVIQTTEPLSCKEKQQFVIRVSPRVPHHQLDEEVLAKPVTASGNVESPHEHPVVHHRDKSTMSREVQEECPKLLMQRRCEEQLMETLLLNSKLTDDLGDAWQQIELLRDRLRQSEKQQPQEILSVGYMYHEREASRPCDTEPISTACRRVSQDTGLASYLEGQRFREKTNTTDQGRLRKLSINCKLPTKKGQLQSTTHDDAPKARSPDFLVDATLSSSVFPFPMVGCQCSSCVSFFSNYKLTNGRNGHDKEIKPLLHLQRQKLPININDYVIVNGNKSGTARYVGHLDNSGMANAVFVGVELDEASGQHDGTFEGKKYFQCYENFAIFVPVHEIFYVINKKPKKSISPPALSAMQHRHSLRPLSSSTNNSGCRGEHSHQANSRKKKQHAPEDLNPTKRLLRKSGASNSSMISSDPSVIPSQEGWSDSNGRTEKESGSSQPKINNRASTITASLPPDLTQYRPVHASIRASPRKVLRR